MKFDRRGLAVEPAWLPLVPPLALGSPTGAWPVASAGIRHERKEPR